MGRPYELSVPVPLAAVLGRGPGLVVALVGAQVHRSGVELAVTIRSDSAHRIAGRHLPERDDQLVLHSRGAGGDGHRVDATYFLSPLPPPGEPAMHCVGPGHGIPETVTIPDTAPMQEAAGHVEVLWSPEDTGPPPYPGGLVAVDGAGDPAGWPFPRPEVPAGGSCDRHLGASG